MSHLFRFALATVEDVPPWGDDPPRLHWFGLTWGTYWLDVGGGSENELFRYSDAVRRAWRVLYPELPDEPYARYHVVRLWEDLLDILPAVLDPVLGDLAELVDTDGPWGTWRGLESWRERHRHLTESEDEALWNLYYQATAWWDARQLNTAHLQAGPGIWFWRPAGDDRIRVRWDNHGLELDGLPAWSAEAGEVQLPIGAFLDEVHGFNDRFLGAMAQRVRSVRAHWPRPDVSVDPDQIEKEQRDREGWLARALVRSTPGEYDWDAARRALATVKARTET